MPRPEASVTTSAIASRPHDSTRAGAVAVLSRRLAPKRTTNARRQCLAVGVDIAGADEDDVIAGILKELNASQVFQPPLPRGPMLVPLVLQEHAGRRVAEVRVSHPP